MGYSNKFITYIDIAFDCNFSLTTEFNNDRMDVISRDEGGGDLGVANFIFTKK